MKSIVFFAMCIFASVGANAQALSFTIPSTAPTIAQHFGAGEGCSYIHGHDGESYKYVVSSVKVTTGGTYSFRDLFVGIDGTLGIYRGPFSPGSLSKNCVASIEDNDSVLLNPGVYTFVATGFGSNASGVVTYSVIGPAMLQQIALANPAPVPAVGIPALIFGALSVFGAAGFLSRRRRST